MGFLRSGLAITAAVLAGFLIGGTQVAGASQQGVDGPTAIEGEFLGSSDPVRTLGNSGASTSPGAVRRRGDASDTALATPAPGRVFAGIGNPLACDGCVPPSTAGDAGPDHYVQAVNATKIGIYDKRGNLLAPAFDLGTLFPTAPCTSNVGGPNVTYDSMADRWVLSQYAFPSHLCFAVSKTADPLGAYYVSQYDVGEFPENFNVGAWPNGYYVSSHESSDAAYAFDRVSMLAGSAGTPIKFSGVTNFMLPADVDGLSPPGPSGGGLFYTFKDSSFHGGAADRIELFRLDPDFEAPANSTFGTIGSIPIGSFLYTVCGVSNRDCIPQLGTAQKIDSRSEFPMQRFPYRDFGDHAALVGNFTIGGGSATPGAMIRWFELRNTGSGWTLFQEGTYAPDDGLNRFNGSIAMNGLGDIALGYSASGSTAFPSIRYATRTASDPPGTLGAERIMIAGGGSQTSSALRWGDSSSMSADPSTDCDFWYTNQYYAATSATTWSTAIGTFGDPSCLPDTSIDSGPGGATKDNTATFTFSSDKAGSSFECRVDGAVFKACSGPGASDTTAALADGPHAFAVRAVNGAGNADATPAQRSFNVDTDVGGDDTRVDGKASARKKQRQRGRKIFVKAKVKAGEDLRAKATGKIKVGKRSYKLKPRTKSVSSGKSKKLKLRPKKSKHAKKIAKALKKGKKAKAKLKVKLTDGAGNQRTQKLSVKLKR